MAQTLKVVEGRDAGTEIVGEPMAPPQVGKSFGFAWGGKPGAREKIRLTSRVTHITPKKERTIIRTENSVYSLEKESK